jgi:hypothetical protein
MCCLGSDFKEQNCDVMNNSWNQYIRMNLKSVFPFVTIPLLKGTRPPELLKVSMINILYTIIQQNILSLMDLFAFAGICSFLVLICT